MRRLFLLASLLTVYSCNNSKLSGSETSIFHDFDFSYDSGWQTSYSLKFTNNNVIFLGNGRRNKSYSIGYINSLQRQKLDSFLIAFSKQKWETAYAEDNRVDHHSYQFYLKTDTSINKVFVYGDIAPKELQAFNTWLTDLKEMINFHPIDTMVKFGSTENFYPPVISAPVKLPSSKNNNSR